MWGASEVIEPANARISPDGQGPRALSLAWLLVVCQRSTLGLPPRS
ncbi:hypothetical protein [Streptomyces coeruleorubidus]